MDKQVTVEWLGGPRHKESLQVFTSASLPAFDEKVWGLDRRLGKDSLSSMQACRQQEVINGRKRQVGNLTFIPTPSPPVNQKPKPLGKGHKPFDSQGHRQRSIVLGGT